MRKCFDKKREETKKKVKKCGCCSLVSPCYFHFGVLHVDIYIQTNLGGFINRISGYHDALLINWDGDYFTAKPPSWHKRFFLLERV